MDEYQSLLYARNIVNCYYNELYKRLVKTEYDNRILKREKSRAGEIKEYVVDDKHYTDEVNKFIGVVSDLSVVSMVTGSIAVFGFTKLWGLPMIFGSTASLFLSANSAKALDKYVVNSKIKKSKKRIEYFSKIDENVISIKDSYKLLHSLKELQSKIDDKLVEVSPTMDDVIQKSHINFEERANESLAKNNVLMKKLG